MASVRYIILAACRSAGLYTQFGFESEAAAWIKKQGSNPCAYIYYRQGAGVAGFDNISVVFGGSNPSAALRRVRDSLEWSLEFRSERQTEVGGFPALAMTARVKKRVYGFGGGIRPVPPAPVYENPFTVTAAEYSGSVILLERNGDAKIVELEYSLNGGEWTLWEEVDRVRTLELQLGDSVRIRNTSEVSTKFSFGAINRYQFSTTTDEGGGLVKLSGDLRSLLMKADYQDLSPEAGTFHSLFSSNDLITNISDLVLAAPVFKANVYNSLFAGTQVRGKAVITGDVAQNSCFASMFSSSNITDVTVTVKTNEGGFPVWLENAPAKGVVRCYPELSLPEGSGSGIPRGWTREDLQV